MTTQVSFPSVQDIQNETDNGRVEDFYRVMCSRDMEIWGMIRSRNMTKANKQYSHAVRMHRRHMSDEIKSLVRTQAHDIPYVLTSDGNIHLYKAGCFKNIVAYVPGQTTLRDRWIQAVEYIRAQTLRPHAVGYIHCFANDHSGRESTEVLYPNMGPPKSAR
jgi:hypothetical protein